MNRLHPSDLRAMVAAIIARENPTHYGPEPAIKAADALLAELKRTQTALAEIREELNCPKCGNPDRDADAAYLYEIRERADKEGWDGLTPLKDWLFAWKDRAEKVLLQAEAAEARVAELEAAIQEG